MPGVERVGRDARQRPISGRTSDHVSIEALFVVFVLLAVVVCVMACVRILREYERAVVFTLGRFERVKGPGLVLIVRCCGC